MADQPIDAAAPAAAASRGGSALLSRRNIVRIHLWLAAFLSPVVILLAVSGGLYLFGVKGSTSATPLSLPADVRLDPASPSLEADVRSLLEQAGIEHDFEYLKVSGNRFTTRPASRTWLQFDVTPDGVAAARVEPSLQKAMIELHMGHGPLLFKDFQKVTAIGLLLVLLSGLWLGLTARGLVRQTIITSGAGLGIALALAFLA